MKKLTTTLLACSISFFAMAQLTTGKIVYKETVKLDIELEGDLAQFRDMIPKEQSFTKALYFSQDESVYKSIPKKAETPAAGGTTRMVINTNTPDEIIYKNTKENNVTAQREFMGRKFLVSGSLEKIDWKMTGKQKNVLGYSCQQATATLDSQQLTVWFAPEIQASTGPGDLNGLPGLILEVDNGKNISIVATEVEKQAQDAKAFSKPTEGKKMSAKQYETMMAAKMKEMQEENGGGGNGNVIIRVQNR